MNIKVVEVINSDGSIKTSESGWNNYLFKNVKYKKGYKLSGFTFQGFIYPPTEFVKELPKEEVNKNLQTETKKEEQQKEIYKYEKLIEKDGIYKLKLHKGEILIIK